MFIEAQGGYYLNEIIADIDTNGHRSGQEHCVILYHFQKSIFIKFEDRWPLIHFWKQLHIQPRDVKYVGSSKPKYHEKELCQENVDIQIMKMKHRNSGKSTAPNTPVGVSSPKEIKINQPQNLNNELRMISASGASSMNSPPPPETYMGDESINGVGIGTAILNHEMLMDEQKMDVNDFKNLGKIDNGQRKKQRKETEEMLHRMMDDDTFRQSITDFNHNNLLRDPMPKVYKKQKSNLEMLMNLHKETNGAHHHIEDTNLSDDEDEFGITVDDEMSEILRQRSKRDSITDTNTQFGHRLNSFDSPQPHKKTSNTYEDSFNDDFAMYDYAGSGKLPKSSSINNYFSEDTQNESPLKALMQKKDKREEHNKNQPDNTENIDINNDGNPQNQSNGYGSNNKPVVNVNVNADNVERALHNQLSVGSPPVPVQHLEEQEMPMYPSTNDEAQTTINQQIENNEKPLSPQQAAISPPKQAPIHIRQLIDFVHLYFILCGI